ncbi:MAG: hypothetical protein J7J61_06555 [Candidatus Hydrothermae bacterium]|nr:hypothetical protein [Candidatus Hydrothermae bacterium]
MNGGKSMDNGWIRLHRRIKKSRLAKDPYELRAWIFLVMDANFKGNEFISKGELINLKRGEVLTSERDLSSSWGVSQYKVRKFLEIWEKEGRIETERTPKGTRIKILNYEKYQGIGDIDDEQAVFQAVFNLETQGEPQIHQADFQAKSEHNKNVYKNIYNNIYTREKFKQIFPANKQHEILSLLHQLGFPKKTLRSRDDQYNLMRIWEQCEGDYTVLVATFKKMVRYRSQIFLFNNGFPGLKTIADRWDWLRTFEPEPDYEMLIENVIGGGEEAFFQTLEGLTEAQQKKFVKILYERGCREAYTLFKEFKGNKERVSV